MLKFFVILELLLSGGLQERDVPIHALHGTNGDSAGNYHLMDEESTGGRVIPPGTKNEESTGGRVIPPGTKNEESTRGMGFCRELPAYLR
jgi:hypothetical protein